ncbi:MAG TPA: HutD family protein [Anaerolineaceae bacterium]|nr:HutD family protein [Anaerolineaceae bacterium]
MKITRLKDIKAVKWAGGKTWQLFILPADASMEARDFDYRLSTAIIEAEHARFSALPGFERDLVLLTEPIILHIFGRAQSVETGKVFHFYGSDVVESEGKTQDLNLIKRAGLPGKLEIIEGPVSGPVLIFDPQKMALIELQAGETGNFKGAVKVDIPLA